MGPKQRVGRGRGGYFLSHTFCSSVGSGTYSPIDDCWLARSLPPLRTIWRPWRQESFVYRVFSSSLMCKVQIYYIFSLFMCLFMHFCFWLRAFLLVFQCVLRLSWFSLGVQREEKNMLLNRKLRIFPIEVVGGMSKVFSAFCAPAAAANHISKNLLRHTVTSLHVLHYKCICATSSTCVCK